MCGNSLCSDMPCNWRAKPNGIAWLSVKSVATIDGTPLLPETLLIMVELHAAAVPLHQDSKRCHLPCCCIFPRCDIDTFRPLRCCGVIQDNSNSEGNSRNQLCSGLLCDRRDLTREACQEAVHKLTCKHSCMNSCLIYSLNSCMNA